jgi:hypothetical protein
MGKDQARKDERRHDLASRLGLPGFARRGTRDKTRRAEEREKAARQRHIDKIEADRKRRRQEIRDSILSTSMDTSFDSGADSRAATETKPADKPR